MFSNKYGVARHIYIPLPKAGSANHAVGADWTPAAGDVKISKDGGAAANVTNLPVAIAMGNSALWDFSLTAAEMQAAQIVVIVADAATKAVDDSGFEIETYGHANAQHEFDLDVPSTAQTGDAYARLGAPAGASTSADIAAVKSDAAAIKTKTDNLPAAPAAVSNIPTAANVSTQVAADLATAHGAGSWATATGFATTNPDNAGIAAIKAKTDNLPAAPAAVSDVPTTAQIRTALHLVAITEAYRANGAAPTVEQAICEILGHLAEASIAGTTKTIKKFDHSTTAETFTLNDGTTPTAITRAT